MWAKVEDNNITRIYARPRQITIGDVNHPANIFELWSTSELEAIGIYEITIDSTNLKDTEYYQEAVDYIVSSPNTNPNETYNCGDEDLELLLS